MKKNFRLNEADGRDKEVIDFLNNVRNESEIIKNALLFYKKALEKKVIYDNNYNNESMWNDIFETAVPLQLIKKDREKVKKEIIRQKKKEEKQRMKELVKIEIEDDNSDEIDNISINDNDNSDTTTSDNYGKELLDINDVIEDTEDM